MLKLLLKLSEFEKLHAKADTKAKTVTIPAGLLSKLLIDHSSVLACMDRHGFKYMEPEILEPPPEKLLEKKRPKLRIRKK